MLVPWRRDASAVSAVGVPMKSLDRMLCVSAGVLGLLVFVLGLRTQQSMWIVVGIIALISGLTAASFVAGRGSR